MQINITKKEFSKEIHMEINTGNTCENKEMGYKIIITYILETES